MIIRKLAYARINVCTYHIEFILSYMTGLRSVYNNYVKPRPFIKPLTFI